MKSFFAFLLILFFNAQLQAQTTVTIVNNQGFDVLVELGWNDNTVLPFLTSVKPHTPDFQCIAAWATGTVIIPPPNWDILKGFKVYCPWGICSTAQSYTDNGPWSGDPGVAPIWHMNFLQPSGSINHYDCSGALIGTIDWNFVNTGCPFPYGDFTITIN